MELLDRYLVHLTLVLALTIYAVASAGVTFVASPTEASINAVVQHTPVVVGLRLELLRHALGQDSGERRPSIDEGAPYSWLCRLGGMPSRQHID